MLDYQAIAALAAVIETQSFNRAAEKLFITQSAVSQRIKSLENHYGEPVLVRTMPYRATQLGATLVGHYKRILILEDSFDENLFLKSKQSNISIAISRDSLETWFLKVIDALKTIPHIQLEIIADDQDYTLDYLRNGIVSACASTSAKHISNATVELIGYFDYVLVASPAFKEKYFPAKVNLKESFNKAPAVVFDQKDQLHAKYLHHFFQFDDKHFPHHVIPSIAGFRHYTLNGYAYALIPEIDITDELKEKKLVKLFPDKIWEMPLYWHRWSVETESYQQFNHLVLKIGKKILRQMK